MNVVIAGRFKADLLVAVAEELAAHPNAPSRESWGMAYCYGNRLETVRAVRKPAGGSTFESIAELKTDMALLCLNDSGVAQPLVRREQSRAWAFACEGEVQEPEKLSIGERVPGPYRPEERLFLHLMDKLDPDDPVASVEGCLPQGLVQPRFFLMNADMLVVGAGALASGSDLELWFGRAQLIRTISPVRFESLSGVQWERIPDRSVMTLARLRRTLA